MLSNAHRMTPQAGFSMVTLLVGLTIATIVGVTVSRMVSSQSQAASVMEINKSKEDIRNLIRVSFSCNETKSNAPASCATSDENIALYDKRSRIMFSDTPTDDRNFKYGLQIKARCERDAPGGTPNVKVYAMAVDKNKNARKIAGKTSTYDRLFTGIPIDCSL